MNELILIAATLFAGLIVAIPALWSEGYRPLFYVARTILRYEGRRGPDCESCKHSECLGINYCKHPIIPIRSNEHCSAGYVRGDYSLNHSQRSVRMFSENCWGVCGEIAELYEPLPGHPQRAPTSSEKRLWRDYRLTALANWFRTEKKKAEEPIFKSKLLENREILNENLLVTPFKEPDGRIPRELKLQRTKPFQEFKNPGHQFPVEMLSELKKAFQPISNRESFPNERADSETT